MKNKRYFRYIICVGFLSSITIWQHNVFSAISPNITREKRIFYIAKQLKPIPDDQWTTIAGDRAAEKYPIVQGDTLWDISNKMFGDSKYWPKIWSLNNDSITNPHLINPGKFVAFLPGSGASLPSVAIQDADSIRMPDGAYIKGKKDSEISKDWKELPKQKWENYTFQLPPGIDPDGFDTKNKVNFHPVKTFSLISSVASEAIEPAGEIVAATLMSEFVSLYDTVMIRSDKELKAGEKYAITGKTEKLVSKASGRQGYSYQLLGAVKIRGQRDNLFVGTIVACYHLIQRGNVLIPLPPRITEPKLIPGPTAAEASLLVDRATSTILTGQHKQVYVDLGSDDGIKPGMVFRAYQKNDPKTQKNFSDDNIIVTGEVLVIQTTPQFSNAFVISGNGTLQDQSPLVLLTDVSDVARKGSDQGKTGDDYLDHLDKQIAPPEMAPEGSSSAPGAEKSDVSLPPSPEAPPPTSDVSSLPVPEATPEGSLPPASAAPEGSPLPGAEVLPESSPMPEATLDGSLPPPPPEGEPAPLPSPGDELMVDDSFQRKDGAVPEAKPQAAKQAIKTDVNSGTKAAPGTVAPGAVKNAAPSAAPSNVKKTDPKVNSSPGAKEPLALPPPPGLTDPSLAN